MHLDFRLFAAAQRDCNSYMGDQIDLPLAPAELHLPRCSPYKVCRATSAATRRPRAGMAGTGSTGDIVQRRLRRPLAHCIHTGRLNPFRAGPTLQAALARKARGLRDYTPRQAAAQAGYLEAHKRDVDRFSACGAADWMRRYQQITPDSPKVCSCKRERCIGVHGGRELKILAFGRALAPKLWCSNRDFLRMLLKRDFP